VVTVKEDVPELGPCFESPG
jgi:hypothetical protein